MEEKNGLNDIILNKSGRSNSAKKVLLTIATFSIILIIVVVIMNRFSGTTETALPHAPEVTQAPVVEVITEPDYTKENLPQEENGSETGYADNDMVEPEMPVEEITEEKTETAAVKKSTPSFEEPKVIEEPVYAKRAAVKPEKKVVPKPSAKPAQPVAEASKPLTARPFGKYDPKTQRVVYTGENSSAEIGHYYIQVGSFAKYAPSKAFLDKIADRGYTYTFHKVNQNGRTLTKVLVGPFKTQASAREALPIVKESVISTAFLIKL